MENCIEVKNLSKSYEHFKLDKLNFTVPKGCIVGFIGENGSGNTTTIKSILNIVNYQEGSVQVLGMDMIEHEQEIKERLGTVLDEAFFYEELNAKQISKILKNVYQNWNEEQFFSNLTSQHIPLTQKLKELSKGMKAKLKIFTAMAHDSKLLILDEPTGGLDPVSRDEILDLFLDFIQNEEHTIFLSTHITSDLDKIADYLVFIHEGKIILKIEKDTLLENYGVIKGDSVLLADLPEEIIVAKRKTSFVEEVLVNDQLLVQRNFPALVTDKTNIEEIMLFMIKGETK